MTRARNSANLASHGNLFVDITNDRTGIGSVVPGQSLHVAGTAGFHADVTFTGDLYNTTWDRSDNSLKFVDNAKAQFGTGNDLTIRHTGSASYIENSTGFLFIHSNDIALRSTAQENYIVCDANAEVEIYYDGSKKLETTAYGTNTTGTAVNDGLVVAGVATVTTMNVTGVLTYDDVTSVDSVGIVTARQGIEIPNDTYKFRSGTSLEMQVWHDGTNSLIKDTRDSGKVRIQADNFDIIDKDASTTVFSAAPGGINSAKLHTFGAGIELDETIAHAGDTNTRIRFPSADRITLETGGSEKVGVANTGVYVNDEFTISGTNGIPLRITGDLGTGDNVYIQNNTSGGHVQFGLRTNDTDGNHHRAFITAEKGSGASANGKLELLARGGNGINGGFIIDKGVGIQASLSIIPTTDSTYDLGTSSLRWDDIYVDDIDVSGSGTFGNDINVANSIVHVGDTNTSIDYGTDQISIKTGGTTRVSVGSTGTIFTDGVTISGNHQFIREGALGSYEQTTIWNQTSGGYIQIGLRQTDSDGPHHRAIIKASKGTGNVTGKFELLARGPGGGTNRGWIIDAGVGIQANLAVIPETNNTYDLGTTGYKWRDINLARNLDVGGTITMSTVAGTNTNASLNILFQTAAGVIDGGSALTYNPAQDVLSVNGNHISRQVFRGDGALGTLTCDNHSSTTFVNVSNKIDIGTVDNVTGAFTVKQGSNEYITIDTTNSSELIKFGTAGSERFRIDSSGNIKLSSDVLQTLAVKNYGYSGSYKSIMVGNPNSNSGTVALCVDVSAISGSSFHAQNQVITGYRGFLTPNAAGNNFIGVFARDASANKIYFGPSTSGGITNGPLTATGDNKIGINESSPSNTLHVAGTTSTSAGGLLRLKVTTGDNFILYDNTHDSTEWAVGNDSATRSNYDVWYNNGSSYDLRTRIDANGYFSIGGTTNVGTLLHIENGSGDAYIRCRGSVNKALLFTNSDGTGHGFIGSGGTNGGGGADLGIQSNSGNIVLHTTNGGVRMPNQPCFQAVVNGSHVQSNSYVVFGSVDVNVGSDYNSSNGVFTASVAGVYLFHISSIAFNNTATVFRYYLHINNSKTGSGNDAHLRIDRNNNGYANQYGANASYTYYKYMNVNDTARVYFDPDDNSAQAYGGSDYFKFSGHLVG